MEKRQLGMHSQMIFDVIKKQAGTLSKAILEGVMNAVDARATELRITVMPKWAELVDNGKGFNSWTEIDDWFETFGKPHEEAERKVFGKFRMGRGQMFAFGRNRWYTNRFHMDVNVQDSGLDYERSDLKGKEVQDGCKIRIDLYDQLMPSDLDRTVRDLELWCKWAPLNIYLNEQLISRSASKSKWHHETDEAYVNLKQSGSLVIYNQGVYVMEVANYKYGTGGEVVTKLGKDLDVNFARNDIIATCPVWKKVSPFIDKKATERNTKKKSLDDGQRQRLVDQLRQGATLEKAGKLKLITAATGRHYAIETLKHLGRFSQYSVAPKGNRLADSLMKQEVALVIAQETLDRFGVATGPDLMTLLKEKFGHYPGDFTGRYVAFDKLTEGLNENYNTLQDKELRLNEHIWLNLMKLSAATLYVDGKDIYGWKGRKILIGVSDVAHGWTDGNTYVVVDRGYLAELDFTVNGFCSLGNLLIHEACHEDLDTVEHDHGQDFYEKFHDTCQGDLGKFVTMCLSSLPSTAKKYEKKLSKQMLKDQDRVARATIAADSKAIARPDEGDEFEDLEDYFE